MLAEALAAHLARDDRSFSGASRVAETGGPYGSGAAGSLATAADAELIEELARRLGIGRARSTASEPDYDRPAVEAICRRYRIRRLSLFGSVVSGDFGPRSDVDVLVEFEPGHTPGLAIQDIEGELSTAFGGRRVDLVTEQALHPLIREQVLANAAVQYVT